MGVVFRAQDVESGAVVALKLLLAGKDAPEVTRRRFAREVQALMRLRHPHVVGIHDAGEHEGAPYLALDYVEGESLQGRLDREGALPEREAAQLVRALADALQHVHEQGALHRDLKPDNVLIRGSDGAPLLTDFGLTRDTDPSFSGTQLTRTGRFLGTPGYWPPEQAEPEHESPRARESEAEPEPEPESTEAAPCLNAPPAPVRSRVPRVTSTPFHLRDGPELTSKQRRQLRSSPRWTRLGVEAATSTPFISEMDPT
jgi:serine/threonine-protein kinase